MGLGKGSDILGRSLGYTPIAQQRYLGQLDLPGFGNLAGLS